MKIYQIKTLVFLTILSLTLSTLANNTLSNDKEFISRINTNIYRHEKLYLHTDKPVYFTGEDLWFSAFLTNARNSVLNTTERVFYVELIKPNGNIATKQIFMLHNGRGNGSLLLKDDLPTGNYLLIAYTNWMRNDGSDFYFNKKITIVNENDVEENTNKNIVATEKNNTPEMSGTRTTSNTDKQKKLILKFYPEGGSLINGIPAKVAFEATSNTGIPAIINGTLTDNNGNMIAAVSTMWDGKGFFAFTPNANSAYKVVLNENEYFELPKVKNEGYQLSIESPFNSDKIIIKAGHKSNNGPSRIFLLAMQDQKPYYALADTLNSSVKAFVVEKSNFKTGVIQFTLFDDQKVPRCERLFFVNHNDNLNIEITPINPIPIANSKIALQIKSSDANGNPVSGSFSLAVTDAKRIGDSHYQPLDFVNYQFFGSNIPSFKGDPSIILENSRRNTMLTDLIMLTNGWRRYDWNEVLKDTLAIPDYLEEPGIYLKGQLLRKNSLKPVSAGMDVTMVVDGKIFNPYNIKTNNNGEFTFLIDDFYGTKPAMIQTKNKMDNKSDFAIELQSNLKSQPVDASAERRLTGNTEEQVWDYTGEKVSNISDLQKNSLSTELVRALDQNFYVDTADVTIDEVTVLAEKVKNIKEVMVKAYGSPSKTVGKEQINDLNEEKPWNSGLISLLSDAIPGLDVTISNNYSEVSTPGSSQTSMESNQTIVFSPRDRKLHRFYIYVDGEMVGATNDKGVLHSMLHFYKIDQLISLDAEIVESIDLIYPPKGKKGFDLNMEALKNMNFDQFQNMTDNQRISIAENPNTPINIPDGQEISNSGEIGININEENENPLFYTSPEAILSIYTKNGQGLYSKTFFKGILNIKLTGFTKSKEFYSPNYEDEKIIIKKDERTTLYWNPQITTDETGTARVEFYNSSVGHLLRAEAVGLSNKGLPGNTRISFGSDTPIVESKKEITSVNNEKEYSTENIFAGSKWSDNSKLKCQLLLSDNSPAKNADITVISKKWGTIANNIGEFYIDKNIVTNNDTIVISYRGDESLIILGNQISETKNSFTLKSNKITNDNLDGGRLFNEAYKNILKTKANKPLFAKNIYRELIFSNNELHRLFDILSYIRIPDYGNTTLSLAPFPIQGRVFKIENYDSNAEFSPINNSPYNINIQDPFYTEVTFLNRNYKKYYNYQYLGQCTYQNRPMYKVVFEQNDDCNFALSKGFALIDIETNGIAYLNWQVSRKIEKYIVPDTYLMGGTTFKDFKLLYEENEAYYSFNNGKWLFKGGNQNIKFMLNNKECSYSRESIITEFLEKEPEDFKPTFLENLNTRFILVKEPKYLPEMWRDAWFLPTNETINKNIPYMHEIIFLTPNKKK
ncbi:MAG: hypothetical protein JW717_00360 [Marinilabiliaceae bacterium]|nr:hypothetical protein [Marinilabiliaceae bacterium]